MEQRLLVNIQRQDWTLEFETHALTASFTIGGPEAEIFVPGCRKQTLLTCTLLPEGYEISLQGACLADMEETTLRFAERSSADLCVQAGDQMLFRLRATPVAPPPVPVYDRQADVPEGRAILIGGADSDDICIASPLFSSSVLRAAYAGGRWLLEPLAPAPLGMYRNVERLTHSCQADIGDFVQVGPLSICLKEKQLLLPSDGTAQVRTLHYTDHAEQMSHLRYPCVNRTSRQLLKKPTDDIPILDPPAAIEEKKNNLVISLLPTAAMIALTVLLRNSFSSNSSMIVFSALSMSIGAVSSVLTYVQMSREGKKAQRKRDKNYREYIGQCEERIQQAHAHERQALRQIYPDFQTELQAVRDFSAQLFDRRQQDEDFWDIRLGEGAMRSAQKITCARHEVFESTDLLFDLPGHLQQKYALVDGLPAVVRGAQAGAVGILGDDEQLRAAVRLMTLDLAVRQYFDDMRLFYFLPPVFQPEMEAVRLLPHVKNPSIPRRSIAHDEESRATLTESLYKLLSDREAEPDALAGQPWITVFIFADDSPIMQHPLMQFVQKAARLKALFIFLGRHREWLPQGCAELIRLFDNTDQGLITSLTASVPDRLFDFSAPSLSLLAQACQRLAPVYSGEISLAARLSAQASLYQMLGVHHAEELNILDAWRRADTTRSMAAPLGMLENGKVLSLDLHESVHGPHGLIAGTTGSGKSQVLISYMLSLASRYSPEDVTFAVIDFKGGDIARQLSGLPHLVGSITNLNPQEIARSLQSVNAEKNRRMMLFSEEYANVSNIQEYTKAYRAGKVDTPLPHLLIIVDEFAELKQQYPEAMQDLISIARVGRSLGIHMILCTQKPFGVVDAQIWSNSDFQLCLRVQTREDSSEVIKSPLASEIREPGRGYLRVGRTEQFELFQSGYSGSPADENLQEQELRIDSLNLSGKRVPLVEKKRASSADDATQRETLLNAIIAAYQASGQQAPAPLCQPPLEFDLPFQERPEGGGQGLITVGLYDDPDNQAIRPLILDVFCKNTLVVGSVQMGKTTLLAVLVRQLAVSVSAETVQIYCMDFNAKTLKSMENLSIIGGVVTENEDEEIKSLLRMLHQEIADRKKLLIESGVPSYTASLDSGKRLPMILVLLDQYAVFKEMYEDSLGDELTFLMREGNAVGISFVVTAQQASELSYRRLHLFSARWVLPLNERGEYAALLEGCRRTLPEAPGRVLLSLQKKIYEGQIFNAFEGKTEAERAECLHSFVQEHMEGPQARPIPVVPEHLAAADLLRTSLSSWQWPYGMNYTTVAPVVMDFIQGASLTFAGGRDEDKQRVIRMIASFASEKARDHQAEVYIFDRFEQPLKDLGAEKDVHYALPGNDLSKCFDAILGQLDQELQMIRQGAVLPDGQRMIFVLINSVDIITQISNDSSLMNAFTQIMEKHRRQRIFFLFADVPNKPVRYASPDLIKWIGEERQALLFGPLPAIKLFEIPLSVMRENSRPLAPEEAFLLQDTDLARIRLAQS